MGMAALFADQSAPEGAELAEGAVWAGGSPNGSMKGSITMGLRRLSPCSRMASIGACVSCASRTRSRFARMVWNLGGLMTAPPAAARSAPARTALAACGSCAT